MEFANYWFESATPSFLAEYVKLHDLEAEAFRGCEVPENFTSITEIERASPESFLFQSGYLSVCKKDAKKLILDYPNMEVLSSVTQLFLYGMPTGTREHARYSWGSSSTERPGA
jgi:hypothetical protein